MLLQGSSAGTTALREEPSLYQSPLSHQSISSFGSPSPRPSAATPSQVTPATPQPPPQPTGAPNDLLASIRTSQFHLRKMSSSFQPTGGSCFLHFEHIVLLSAFAVHHCRSLVEHHAPLLQEYCCILCQHYCGYYTCCRLISLQHCVCIKGTHVYTLYAYTCMQYAVALLKVCFCCHTQMAVFISMAC